MIEFIILTLLSPLLYIFINYLDVITCKNKNNNIFDIFKYNYIYDMIDYENENEPYMLNLYEKHQIHLFKNCIYNYKKYEEIILYYGDLEVIQLIIYEYEKEKRKYKKIKIKLEIVDPSNNVITKSKEGFKKFHNLFLYKTKNYDSGIYTYKNCYYNNHFYQKIEIDIINLINIFDINNNNNNNFNDLLEMRLINMNHTITFYPNIIE